MFPLPDGRARFVVSAAPDTRLAAGRFHLTTRRGKQWNSMVQADVDALTGAARDHLFMNVDDMRALGLAQDEAVRVSSAHGAIALRAFAAEVTRGNVQAHFPEANPLIGPGVRDPGGLVPDYNAVVQIAKAGRERWLKRASRSRNGRCCACAQVGGEAEAADEIAVEEPLEIRVAGDTLAITMRTPGADRELALGFLLGEGVIASRDDVGQGHALRAARRSRVRQRDRRGVGARASRSRRPSPRTCAAAR